MAKTSDFFGRGGLRRWGNFLHSEDALLLFFRGLLGGSFVANALIFLATFTSGQRELIRVFTLLTIGGLIAFCWVLCSKKPLAAVKVFTVGLWLAITTHNSLLSGLQSASVMVYPFLIALGGFVLGPRWLLGLTLASLMAVLAHGLAQAFGGWSPSPPASLAARIVVYATLTLIMGAMVFAAWSSFQAAVERANSATAELEQRNQALQRSERDMQVLMDAVPAFIAAFDASMRLRLCNLGQARLFGFQNSSEPVGQSIEHLLGPNEWPQVEPHWREACAGRPTAYRHTLSKAQTGVVRVLDVVLIPQLVEGSVTDVFTLVTDVTRQVQTEAEIRQLNASLEAKVLSRTRELQVALEKLQHSQEELGRSGAKATLAMMAASVAHELNTPLGNSVITSSTLGDALTIFKAQLETSELKRTALVGFVSQQEEGLQLLQRNLERATVLVRNFQQVANDQASEGRREFDLGISILELLATLAPTLRRSPNRVEVTVPEGIRLDSFPGALGQVVVNLVNNAFLHAFDGMSSGTLKISADRIDDRVLLQFTDNGVGMCEEVRNRLFEPFFSTKLGQGGTGLGMHIVQSIVERTLGGTINVTSIPRATSAQLQGTSITVTLPLTAP